MKYRVMKTEFWGHLLIRTEPSGYELVWEVGLSKADATRRRRFWQSMEG